MAMDVLALTTWTGSIVVLLTCVVLAILSARLRIAVLGAVGVLPVAAGLIAHAVGLVVAPPNAIVAAVAAVALFALGVTAGGPITLVVLRLAGAQSVLLGQHGGIVPAAQSDGATTEVLRGGATIGYLERIAVLGCLAVGRVEGIAVIVAVKGLGRFSELETPEARERFIIGTLVSLIWAGATGALLLMTV